MSGLIQMLLTQIKPKFPYGELNIEGNELVISLTENDLKALIQKGLNLQNPIDLNVNIQQNKIKIRMRVI